jgi:hypothetical protein
MSMHRRHRTAVAIGLVTLLMAGGALARTVYVSTRYAKVRDGRTSASAQVARVDFGQALDAQEEQQGFLHVKLPGGQAGWIAKLWTSEQPPPKEGLGEKLGQAARSGGGEVTYTAGARGLADEAKTYAAGKDLGTAAAAVERLEKQKVDDAALEAFLEQGKLGDWRALAIGVTAPGGRP